MGSDEIILMAAAINISFEVSHFALHTNYFLIFSVIKIKSAFVSFQGRDGLIANIYKHDKFDQQDVIWCLRLRIYFKLTEIKRVVLGKIRN